MAWAVGIADNEPMPSGVVAGENQREAGWGALYAEDRLAGGGRAGREAQGDRDASEACGLGPDAAGGVEEVGLEPGDVAGFVAAVGHADRDLDELASALSLELAGRLDGRDRVADVAEAFRLPLRNGALGLEARSGQQGHEINGPRGGDGEAIPTGAVAVSLAMGDEGAGDAKQRPRGEKAGDEFKNGQKKTSLG